MIATSGFLTALECTKFAPDRAGGAYSTPPDIAGLRGPTSKGTGGERTGKERGGRGRGRGGTRNGENGREGVGIPGKGEGKGRSRIGGEGSTVRTPLPSIPAYAPERFG